MKLTAFSDYTLRVLMFLAVQDNRLATIPEIAAAYGISENHLKKVVHQLARSGVIETVRGKGGGIRLACKPDELRLGDLVLALEPNMYLVECFNLKTNTCRVVSACKLKHFLGDASKAFINTLDQHTLDDVVISKQAVVGCR